MKTFLVSIASMLLFLAPLRAEHPFKISEDLDHTIQKGLNELYSFDFQKSVDTFNSVKSQQDEHPMVAFGVASAEWWRISANVLEGDPAESAPFLKAADECIRVAQQRIDKGDPTGEGHLVLGGALGLLGRWESTNRKWISAYRKGKKAYRYLTQSLEINPQLKDAYMGLGIFDYYVATLPAFVRTLAFLGSTNDKSVGLRELTTAAYESNYARTPSQLFLAQIYAEQENQPERAATILAELRKEYTVSPFIHMLQIISFYNANKLADLEREALDFAKRVDTGVYTKDQTTTALFAQGAALFKQRKWDEAARYFALARDSHDEKSAWRTWSILYLGYCLDVQGKRDEAKDRYKEVLGLLRRWGSQDNAKAHLEKPFHASDKELKKLTL